MALESDVTAVSHTLGQLLTGTYLASVIRLLANARAPGALADQAASNLAASQNVTDPETAQAAVQKALRTGGGLDIWA